MKQSITLIIRPFVLVVTILLNVEDVSAQEQIYKYNNSSEKSGYSIVRQDNKGLSINFSVNQFSTVAKTINGKMLQNLAVPGMFLQNEAGHPDLPGNGRYIAIPQGSKAVLKVVSYTTETIKNMDITPAPVIPLVTDDSPLVYQKNNAIYSKNAFYPATPVILSEPTQLRGIDVVLLGITPFQYNPVTKDLIVYKDIKIEINFEGGNGHFGNDSYRSRWWDPILEDAIFNYNQLPVIDYSNQFQKTTGPLALTGCEYAIIVPTAPEFSQWADSIKKFRTEQGILTHVYTLSDIGASDTAGIKMWVTDAYNNWDIKPAAMLILADYGTSATTTVASRLYPHPSSYPDFASDNYYADVTGDDLPEITFSRIVANNATQLQVMCSKFLKYERNPPTDPTFYNKPLTAMGWQDDRWFQVCAETVSGFFKTLGKSPVRVNALGSPASNTGNNTPNTGIWSTNTNTTTIINYFGPAGLNYIPDKPGTLGGFSGGTATGINTAINNGSFFALHRDHGSYSTWGTPSYSTSNINSLANVNNKLPFVFSINCQTGAYHISGECFAEKLHRYTKNGQNSGALGLIADSETSYSFVNDVMVWGMFDNMWPNFMPAQGTNPPSRDIRPAFANVAAKYFLQQSNWPYNGGNKQVTYRLYHMFGEAFQWFYSEVPQNLTVIHNTTTSPIATSFNVTANVGSLIAITTSTPTGPIILGTATGTGSSVAVPLSQSPTTNILVTVTKQNYFRYSKSVALGPISVDEEMASNNSLICYPNPFSQSTTISYSLDQSSNVTLSVYDMLGKEVAVIIDNAMQSSGTHRVQFSSKNLPSGTYSCVLRTDSYVVTKNVVIEE